MNPRKQKKLKNEPDCWQQPIQSCMCCGRLSPKIMPRLVPYDMKSRPYTPIWTVLFGLKYGFVHVLVLRGERLSFFFLSCCSFNFQRSLRYRRKENINIFLRTKLDRPFPSCHFQLKGVWTFTAKLSRVVMGNFWTELFFVPSWHLRRTSWFSTCNLANSRTVVATAVKCPVLCHLHVVVICRHHYRLHTLVPCEELTTKRVAWLRGGQVLTAAQVGRGGKGTAKWTPELIF
jgi:hypothetical protein